MRICDQTGELPRFAFDDEQAVCSDDLELIEPEPAPRSIAPVALDSSELEEATEELTLDEEPPRRARWAYLALAAAGALAVVGLASVAGSSSNSTVQVATIVPMREPPPPPEPVKAPPPPPPPPPIAPAIAAPTTGTIVTPLWAKGRRVWVDGKPIAGHAPKIEAACGKHQVKIGAYGKTRKADIPCGGEIKLAP